MAKKERPAAVGPTRLYEDEESFRKPLDQAIEACRQAFVAASATVLGAEARVRAALNDFNDLKAFRDAVAVHLRAGSFRDLPGFRREGLNGFHHLTVGPWRGVFLVSNDGSEVIGMVFSKYPHHLGGHFVEVAKSYQTAELEKPEKDS